MKKKGFTLVELLATIVVLSVIVLIATPIILNVIEKAKKGALVSSVNGLVESANMYYTNEIIKGDINEDVVFDFEEGIQTSTNKLSYKGKVYNGKLILTSDSDIITCIDDGKYYAYKEKDSDEVISGIGTCLYDGTTGDFTIESDVDVIIKECDEDKKELQEQITNLTTTVNNLQDTINEKEQAISDLTSIKEGLENQLTTLEGEKEELIKQIENSNLSNSGLNTKITELEGTIDTLESSIEAKNNEITVLNGEKTDLQTELTEKTNELKTLNENLGKVTASAFDVLSGKTILTSSGLVTGSMTNNGSVSKTLNAGGSYTIPKGYHDGTGKVTANTLASQTKVDSGKTAITASQVLTGYQGWVNGNKVTGTMTNKAGTTTAATTVTESGDNALITIPANGYYSTSSKISVPIETLNSNLSGDLLWENSNPNIEFVPQTISVDLSKYKKIRVSIDYHTTIKTTEIFVVIPVINNYTQTLVSGLYVTDYFYVAMRGMNINTDTNTLFFTQGEYIEPDISRVMRASNSHAIPTKIFGIK